MSSQQFAVNNIMHKLSAPHARGLYAVNGPPGTGKTTLLRDLIAAIVVQRAEVLAGLPGPRAAFRTGSEAMKWPDPENPQSFPDADYLSGAATLLSGEPCWAAVAARLGKRPNRSDFVALFWW
ncbi:hypothetical protein ACFWPH_07335 [Nocardia sp. NPDC058499]|uniref:hypothetical protein n=1 Tax=Nocardia sp. NPDC058499 TaxID=3346530 RepID=UPI0036611573